MCKKNAFFFTFLGVAFICMFLLGRRTKICRPEIITLSDTVVRIDTLRDTVCVAKTAYISKIDTCIMEVPGDTVKVPVLVPIERREYKTEDYHALIEGYRPSLVSMEVYPQTKIVTQTQIRTVTKKTRWGIGPQVGYGFNGKEWAPYVGIGVQYNICAF